MKSRALLQKNGLTLVILVTVLWVSEASAEIIRGKGDFRDGKIAVDLVSEVKSIRAGEPFTVGVRIIHAPGWHTYWKSPGVAGVPTNLEWEMPKGFKADPFQWPAPQRSEMAGMTVYGYEGECLLPMRIHPPEQLKPDKDGKIRLKVRAAWMTCAISCHPGWQDFVLELPVTDGKPEIDKEWREAFQQARARFPVPASEKWDFDVVRNGQEITLTVKLPESVRKDLQAEGVSAPYFFAEENQVKSSAPQTIRYHSDGSFSITMKVSKYATKDTKQLMGVLAFDSSWIKDVGEGNRWVRVKVPWKKS